MNFLRRAAVYDNTKSGSCCCVRKPSPIVAVLLFLSVCALAANATCVACPSWVDKYIYFINVTAHDYSSFRVNSIGLWRVCYFEDFDDPSLATRCLDIKFNDFTLVVQISECLCLVMNVVSVVVISILLVNTSVQENYMDTRIHKEGRKYLFISNLVASMAICVAVPLYITDANREGVGFGEPTIQQLIEQQPLPEDTDFRHIPYYSMFAWALWTQLGSLVFNATLTFMGFAQLVAYRKKHRQGNGQQMVRGGHSSKDTKSVETRPRSESRRVLFTRQSSAMSLQTIPSSPNEY